MEATATILGIPNIPTITEVNVREGRTVNSPKMFTVPVGLGGLKIKRVRRDKDNTLQQGGKGSLLDKINFSRRYDRVGAR